MEDQVHPDWDEVSAEARDWGREATQWADETALLTFWPDDDVPPVEQINHAVSAHERHLWDADGTVSPTLAEAVGGDQWSGVTVVALEDNPHLHVGLAVSDPVGTDAFRSLRDEVVKSSPVFPAEENGPDAVSVRRGTRADPKLVSDYLARNITEKASSPGRTAVVASNSSPVLGPVGPGFE